MGKKSKDKGKAGERELTKMLGKYFEENFERVPSSGAFIGGRNAFRKERMSENQIRGAKADIIPPDGLSKFVAECKWYGDFPYHALATNKQIPKLNEWIEELEYDCDKNDHGFLFVKIDHKGWFVAFKYDLVPPLTISNFCLYNNYCITSAEEFLEHNHNAIKKMCF